jgi:Holliday junction resolvase RusA-like endonuclease
MFITHQIAFTVPVVPVPKARHRTAVRHGHAIAYTDPKARSDIETFIAHARPNAPDRPLTGALSVRTDVYLPIPMSWSKKKTAAALSGELRPLSSRSDIDNFVKFALDCMNGQFFGDDHQVVKLSAEKRYSDVPRWEITIQELAG